MSHEDKNAKHTTGGIPRWSPTLVLVARFSAYVWQSGRDAQFSLTYGRMYLCMNYSINNLLVLIDTYQLPPAIDIYNEAPSPSNYNFYAPLFWCSADRTPLQRSKPWLVG